MVVPEELNLLDFSNIEVHINVKHVTCIWFEGSSENTDKICGYVATQLDMWLHRMRAIYELFLQKRTALAGFLKMP